MALIFLVCKMASLSIFWQGQLGNSKKQFREFKKQSGNSKTDQHLGETLSRFLHLLDQATGISKPINKQTHGKRGNAPIAKQFCRIARLSYLLPSVSPTPEKMISAPTGQALWPANKYQEKPNKHLQERFLPLGPVGSCQVSSFCRSSRGPD